MKPILIYDGHCNLCIGLIKLIETWNVSTSGTRVNLVPFQEAKKEIDEFSLDPKRMEKEIHFISMKREVLTGAKAVEALKEIFPLLSIGASFFGGATGSLLYQVIAENRVRFFGCSEACYVSKQTE
ncbi:MAG: DUF393 domain-containing protein [Chloroherpetonaceae bacterium]|nr:DUF393 domain-containing protein [Chloroherpetonaceae bacterium]